MGFVYIPSPGGSSALALKIDGTNAPTATMDWGSQDLVDVARLGIGTNTFGTYELLKIESAHPTDWVVLGLESTSGQPTVFTGKSARPNTNELITGLFGYWASNVVAGINILTGNDTVNQDEGHIAFYTRDTGEVAVSAKFKVEQDGSVWLMRSSGAHLKWTTGGTGDIGDGSGSDPRHIFFTGNLNGIAAADFDTLTDGSNADSLHSHTSGDVNGPASSTDNAIARFDSTTGKLLQDSVAVVSDAGTIGIPYGQTALEITGTTGPPTSKITSTGNELRFYVREDTTPKLMLGQYASAWKLHFVPTANNSYDIGTIAKRWRTAYFANTINLSSGGIDAIIDIQSGGAFQSGVVRLGNQATGANTAAGIVRSQWQGNTIAEILMYTGTDTTNKDDGYIVFKTAEGGTLAEQMRIEQDGNVAIEKNLAVKGQVGSPLNTLTDAASIATDCDTGNVHVVTLADNRALANPTNMIAGSTYTWIIKQDSTGSRTLSYGTAFKFNQGTAPTLTTTADAIDILRGVAESSSVVHCNIDFDSR